MLSLKKLGAKLASILLSRNPEKDFYLGQFFRPRGSCLRQQWQDTSGTTSSCRANSSQDRRTTMWHRFSGDSRSRGRMKPSSSFPINSSEWKFTTPSWRTRWQFKNNLWSSGIWERETLACTPAGSLPFPAALFQHPSSWWFKVSLTSRPLGCDGGSWEDWANNEAMVSRVSNQSRRRCHPLSWPLLWPLSCCCLCSLQLCPSCWSEGVCDSYL